MATSDIFHYVLFHLFKMLLSLFNWFLLMGCQLPLNKQCSTVLCGKYRMNLFFLSFPKQPKYLKIAIKLYLNYSPCSVLFLILSGFSVPSCSASTECFLVEEGFSVTWSAVRHMASQYSLSIPNPWSQPPIQVTVTPFINTHCVWWLNVFNLPKNTKSRPFFFILSIRVYGDIFPNCGGGRSD